MSIICLNNFHWPKLMFSKLRFFGPKKLSPVQFLGSSTARRYIIEFSIFLLQLRDQRSRSKTVCGFPLFWFWKELWCFKVKEYVHWYKKWTLIKLKQNQKWKIPHTFLEQLSWELRVESSRNKKYGFF